MESSEPTSDSEFSQIDWLASLLKKKEGEKLLSTPKEHGTFQQAEAPIIVLKPEPIASHIESLLKSAPICYFMGIWPMAKTIAKWGETLENPKQCGYQTSPERLFFSVFLQPWIGISSFKEFHGWWVERVRLWKNLLISEPLRKSQKVGKEDQNLRKSSGNN